MPGNAKIGALHVSLGIDSAQFSAGLAKAQKGLGNFGALAGRTFAAVAAGATLAAGALGIAVKGAIDHADALSKASQKAGVTVEALSRLEYAAKLSDVSLEQLTGGLQKLSKGMADAAGGKGPAAAFKALGIAVTESNGQLRDGNAVFADIADRFSRLEDGATKTALAIQIFGKSGADMIPLLNEGADGLKRYADESDRLGATISTKTAKASEKFNDTLTTVQVSLQVVVNKIIASDGVLSALQGVADLLASPEFAAAAQTAATNLINAMASVIGWIADVKENWRSLQRAVNPQFAVYGPDGKMVKDANGRPVSQNVDWAPGQGPRAPGQSSSYKTIAPGLLSGTFGALGGSSTYGSTAEMWASLKKPLVIPPFQTDDAVKSLEPLDLGIDATTTKIETLADKIGGPLSNAIIGFKDAVMSGTNPLKAFADQLGNIGSQLANSAIQGLVSAALGGISFGGVAPGGIGSGFRFGGPTFDGGGYTGMGSRSGGLDGKGGFLGMLHPDETVIDHSKGQGGPVINVTVNADTLSRGADIANSLKPVMRDVIVQYEKNRDRR